MRTRFKQPFDIYRSMVYITLLLLITVVKSIQKLIMSMINDQELSFQSLVDS